jgi:ABC-type glycerol-3-phosphate transport system substrate-binding protein
LALDWDAQGHFAAADAVPGLESRFGFVPPPPAPGASSPFPALLAWGLAVNSRSERQEEAWLFAQYFTDQEFQSFLAIEGGGANPPRRSVFESREFQERIQSFEGYAGALADALNRGRVPLTPTRQVFRLAGHWASVIRDIESGLYPSVQAGLDNLNRWLDARLAEAKERESP